MGGVRLWSKGERGGGVLKPQTAGMSGGDVRGRQRERLPTSKAASLGAQAAEVWPCAPLVWL